MNRIDREIDLLLDIAASGKLPGYAENAGDSTFYAENAVSGITEHFSGEIDSLERRLNEMWAKDAALRDYIPLILAAVEKSRTHDGSAVVRTELYNYTM